MADVAKNYADPPQGQAQAGNGQPGAHAATQAPVKEFKGKGLEAYKNMFRRSEEACAKARELSHRDRDWCDNFDDGQWSQAEKAVLVRRNQPIVTSNRIKRKVGFLCGLEQRQRTDPKAFPRTKKNEDGAQIATQVLDYIEGQTRFDHTASASFRDLAVSGIEAAEVIVDDNGEIEINLIQFDSFFGDPRSKKTDYSDARYLGYQDWFDADDVIDMFAGEDQEANTKVKSAVEGALNDDSYDEGYQDKPYGQWGDTEQRRVRVACMYWRGGGTWNYVYFTGAGVLKEGVSLYLDDKGKPECAIKAASVYMTRKNERYGVVRDMISPQSEMNMRRSLSLSFIRNRRTWARAKGILPTDVADTLARPDGSLVANGKFGEDWGFVDSQAEIAGNFELLQEAKSEIDVQGPNAGLQGRGVEDQSGKAIALQQNAGATEENDIFDAHTDWKLRIYRSMWARAKQYWTEERYVRVTDENDKPAFVPINQPQPAIDPATGQPMMHPETGQPMAQAGPDGKPMMQNALAEIDVDIILEAVPDVITLQHEEFQELAQMAGNGVPIPPDVLIEASQIKDKRKLLDKMKENNDTQAQLQQAGQMIETLQKQLQQMQQQLQKAQQTPIQKPPTPLDMVKAQTEQAKQGLTAAQTEHTRAQTAQIAKDIHTPPDGPDPMTPMDAADIEHKRAQTMKTYADADKSRVDAAKVVHDIQNPPPPPQVRPRPNGSGQ